MKYRVCWRLPAEVGNPNTLMASEYETIGEADYHCSDIRGWVAECWIVQIDDNTPCNRGPFQVDEQAVAEPESRPDLPTIWDRIR